MSRVPFLGCLIAVKKFARPRARNAGRHIGSFGAGHSTTSLETAMTHKFLTGARALVPHPLALACSMALAAVAGSAHADQAADMQMKLDSLQQQVTEMKTQMATKPAASPVQIKPGGALTFQFGDKSELTLYGHVDLSVDYQTTGLSNAVDATGHNGWVS